MCLTHSPDRRPDSRTLLALPSLRTKARELGISLQVDPATNPDGPPRGMPPERQPAYEEHPRRGGAYDAGHGRERREGAREGRWAGVGGAPGGGGGAWRDGGAPRGVVPERWDGAVREVEEGRGGREARGGAEGALERNRYVARDMGETPTREEYLARAAYEAYERELGGRERGVGEVERRMGGMMVGRGEGVGAALRHEDGVVGAGRPRDARGECAA